MLGVLRALLHIRLPSYSCRRGVEIGYSPGFKRLTSTRPGSQMSLNVGFACEGCCCCIEGPKKAGMPQNNQARLR